MYPQQQVIREYDLQPLQQAGEMLLIAVISDTHGAVDADVLDIVANSDVVMHAGDIMGEKVLSALKPRTGTIIAVRGNNDRPETWHSSEHQSLQQIPDVALVKTSSGLIAMEHSHMVNGIEWDQSPLAYKYPQARVVVYGHTHVEKVDNELTPWLVNPGVAGLTRNQGGPCCYQLQVSDDNWSLKRFKFVTMQKTA